MKIVAKKDENMERVLVFMERFVNDEEVRGIYDKINDVERDAKEQGLAEGQIEGRHYEKFEIARNLLEMNLDIDSIMKATGLIKKEVEALK